MDTSNSANMDFVIFDLLESEFPEDQQLAEKALAKTCEVELTVVALKKEATPKPYQSLNSNLISFYEESEKLLNDLYITKDDAELYTTLKDDRHDASYATDIKFDELTIIDYENRVLDFINKTEDLIQK